MGSVLFSVCIYTILPFTSIKVFHIFRAGFRRYLDLLDQTGEHERFKSKIRIKRVIANYLLPDGYHDADL